MDVTDDIEWPTVGAAVGPQRDSLDLNLVDFIGCRKYPNMVKPFALHRPHRSAQIVGLLSDNVGSERAVGAPTISLLANARGKVEHNSCSQNVTFPCEIDERFAVFGLDVCRIDNRQSSCGQALFGDVVEYVEGGWRSGLIVFVVSDQGTTKVG